MNADEIVRALRNAADRWEKRHPVIGVGELRVQDALRDSANAIESLTRQLAEREREIERLREALEIAKRGHVDCMSAERQADGKCLGYGRGENDDEPCAQCSNCPQCTAYEPERKPINEWAALDGICVLDPDGFDRSDPYVLEREITKAEYLAGIWRCTVMPLPAAPEEGKQI
jgi:hypothetical protein